MLVGRPSVGTVAAWRDLLGARISGLEKVCRLVLTANETDWKANSDEEADIAWGIAIQAARAALDSGGGADNARTATSSPPKEESNG
jgi:hypothetical protein